MHLFKHAVSAVALIAGGIYWSSAHAVTFTVDTLSAGLADANAGDGVCQTATPGECSLRAALEEANALPVAVPGVDDAVIVFDAALNGDIEPNAGAQLMFTTTLGSTVINDYLGFGAFYHVNALRPVTIDFDNRVGIIQANDLEYAAFFIQSNDVVIQNFRNADRRDIVAGTIGGFGDSSGITGGASAFVIGGSRVTLRNGQSSEPSVDSMESCVSLIDGASDILIEDYYCRRSGAFGLYVDERATVSNIVLNRFEASEGRRFGDVWIEFGEGGELGAKTVVNGLTITDSEFRSAAINYTVGLRENSVIEDFSVTGSRFLGSNAPSIYAYPTSALGAVNVENNSATDTGFFFGTDVNVAHTGLVGISDNVLTGNLSDAIFLQSPTSGTVIENNQILNQRSSSLVAGVRIASGASGTNNVIRNNVFDQASPVTEPAAPVNRFAVWMRANPSGAGGGGAGGGGSTGWSVVNNTIRNILGSDFGPIYNDGDGDTLISGNTFGEGTRGAVPPDPAPENDDSFFVVNADQFSNFKIQTWRPTGAVFSGLTIRATFAPVNPPRAGNNAPVNPVFIDAYYTATDKAETYLGRIPGTHSDEVTFVFTSTAAGGGIRAQVTEDVNGNGIFDSGDRSSQYSGATELVMGLDAGADDDMDGLPNGAECTINALGIPLLCQDSDLDGTADYLDSDDDNDGIPTRVECPNGSPCVNTDGDLFPNHLDLDSDADGLSDSKECPSQECRDTDGDGAANYVDTDSDGDGQSDAIECPLGLLTCRDADANGVEDYLERPEPIVVRGTGGGSFGHWALLALGGLALLRRRAALFAGLLGLVSAFGVQAADDESWTSRFYVGAKVGALFTDFDKGDLTRTLQDAGYDVQAESDDSDKLGYGLWLGYGLNSALGLELSYTTGADERVKYSGSTVSDLQGVLDKASPHLEGYGDSYLLRLRYHHALSDRWFLSPHIGAGITQTRESVKSGNRRARLEEESFTWALGAGLHYALTPDWSIGAGADYYASSSDNAYSMISGIVEWRFPRALRENVQPIPALQPEPVEVVPLATMPAPETETAPETAPSVQRIDLRGVNFETNSDQLTQESRQILDGAAASLQSAMLQAPQLQVQVAGHTDNVGSSAHNQRLSQARAHAVANYLSAHGVDGTRLSAVGYGDSQAIALNDTAEGRALNRRVELKMQE